MKEKTRCEWCGADEIYKDYHDTVWGVPNYDAKDLFGKLILDGAQAGLSWITILKRQQGYLDVFDNLDPIAMATYNDDHLEIILQDRRIIRNRLKVYAARSNAQAYVDMADDGIDFAQHLWSFVDGSPIQNRLDHIANYPTTSLASDAMSKDLKQRGFKFVGSTICYAFMQAVGMYNDHLTSCFRHDEVSKLSNRG